MIRSLLAERVLTALIAWPERVEQEIVDLKDVYARLNFIAHFRSLNGSLEQLLGETDLAATLNQFPSHSNLSDWWSWLLVAGGIAFDFSDSEPKMQLDSIEAWERVLGSLDGDALVTLALVERQRHAMINADARCIEKAALGDLETMNRWQTLLRPADRELETLWSNGLSDMHIHTGGVRFGQAVWFDFVDGVADPLHYKIGIRDLNATIASGLAAREALWSRFDCRPEQDAPLLDEGKWWRWSPRRLFGERTLLVRAWCAAAESKPSADDTMREEQRELLSDLDRYLFAKSSFLSTARQPLTTSPGLDHFKHHQDALKGPSHDIVIGPRLRSMATGDALVFLGESYDLERVELRYAPPTRPSDIGRQAIAFGLLLRKLNKERRRAGRSPLDARMAFHLKRSRKWQRGRTAQEGLGKVLRQMDRETASMRLALWDPTAGPILRNVLARVDIAGQERDTALIESLPYLSLVLGDPATLAGFRDIADDDPRIQAGEFEHWRTVIDAGAHLPAVHERRLGITIHAGEDFSDPLSGLHEVATAVELGGLRAGDGIGHGIALKIDPHHFAASRGDYALISAGTHMDSLAWLHNRRSSWKSGE